MGLLKNIRVDASLRLVLAIVSELTLRVKCRVHSGEQNARPVLLNRTRFQPTISTMTPHVVQGADARSLFASILFFLHSGEHIGTSFEFQLLGVYTVPQTTHV